MKLMHKEIAEQPELLRSKWKYWTEQAQTARAELSDRRHLALVGRGSSGHACTFATYLHAAESGRHPIEVRPWVFTQAPPKARWEDVAVHAYSVSGQSTDIARTASQLREAGAKVLGVTNASSPNCNLARASDTMLYMDAGDERAVPATKTFTAQLFVSAALAGCDIEAPAKQVADGIAAIAAKKLYEQLAKFIEGGRCVYVVARGPALAAALDGVLKMQEASGQLAAAYSAAEILHGPVRSLSHEDRVVVLEDEPGGGESRQAVLTHMVAEGIPHVTITSEGSTEHLGLALPMPEARWARTPLMGALFQWTALELATRRGLDPDQPPGLNKVTFT